MFPRFPSGNNVAKTKFAAEEAMLYTREIVSWLGIYPGNGLTLVQILTSVYHSCEQKFLVQKYFLVYSHWKYDKTLTENNVSQQLFVGLGIVTMGILTKHPHEQEWESEMKSTRLESQRSC